MKRDEIISQLKKYPKVSVLIIGAGINGIGTFRDLALNGVNVLLVDKADYLSGASSASSHMAHGGIRYLENGEFRLVHEAVEERNRMIKNAPHRVNPLPTTIPIFKVWSGLLNAPLKFLNLLDRPSERGAIVIKIGLIIYDSYTRKQKTVPTHQFHNRDESLKRYPSLNQAIKYTATYFDGQILSPERYGIDLIKDALAEGNHATALNYVGVIRSSGTSVQLRDEITGEEFSVIPEVIVNAAGPWIDQVNDHLGFAERYIGGTKGSHLVLDVPELRKAIGDHEFFFENKDGRIVLIFPFYDKVIVGTSDLPAEDIDHVVCTGAEENYFIDLVSRIFPEIKISKENIVFRFSGVRPLEFSKAKSTGQITRDHTIKHDHFGQINVLSLVGGKWTSYRAFSAQACDEVLTLLGKLRKKGTEDLKVRGGANYPAAPQEKEQTINRLANEFQLSPEYAGAMFMRYGTSAHEEVQQFNKISTTSLHSLANWTQGEVKWLIRDEDILHLEDLFLRRSTLAWLGELTRDGLFEFAELFADELGWTEDQKAKEIDRTSNILREYHGLQL